MVIRIFLPRPYGSQAMTYKPIALDKDLSFGLEDLVSYLRTGPLPSPNLDHRIASLTDHLITSTLIQMDSNQT